MTLGYKHFSWSQFFLFFLIIVRTLQNDAANQPTNIRARIPGARLSEGEGGKRTRISRREAPAAPSETVRGR